MGKNELLKSIILFLILFLLLGTLKAKYKTYLEEPQGEIKYVIGVSYGDLSEPWQVALNDEIQEEASKNDDIRVISTDATNCAYKQIKDFDKLMEFGADILIVTVNDTSAIKRYLSRIYSKIPIILINRGISGYDYTLFIGPDDFDLGKKAGEKTAELLKETGGNVVEIRGPIESPGAAERNHGFMSALKQYPNIRIYQSLTCNWQKDEAKEKFYNFVKVNKNIDVVFAHDNLLLSGAYEGAKMAGLDQIRYIGIGNSYGDFEDNLPWDEKSDINTFLYPLGGKEAVKYSMEILKNKQKLPKKVILRSIFQNSARLCIDHSKEDNIILDNKSNAEQVIKVGFIKSNTPSDYRPFDYKRSLLNIASRNIEVFFEQVAYDNDETEIQINQIKCIRELIQKKVDVIIFSPIVETGWENIIEEVHEAGISLIVFNEELDDKYQCLFFGYDCKDEGRMAARWLVENIYNDTMDIRVAEINGYEKSFSTQARREGFNEIIRDYSRINIAVSKNGYNNMSGGKRAMEEILAEAKVNVLFVHGEEMALGAVEVVKKHGLQPGKDIIVITVGSSDNILKAMQDGSLNCIIKRQDISNKLIINIINDLISNETIPKKVIIGNEVIF